VPEELKRLRRLRGRDQVAGSSHGDKGQAVVHHAPAANLQQHNDTTPDQNSSNVPQFACVERATLNLFF